MRKCRLHTDSGSLPTRQVFPGILKSSEVSTEGHTVEQDVGTRHDGMGLHPLGSQALGKVQVNNKVLSQASEP